MAQTIRRFSVNPSRMRPATFSADKDTHLSEWNGVIADVEAAAAEIEGNAVIAEDSAAAALVSENNAAGSAGAAAASAQDAANAAGVIAWVSGTTYAEGDQRFSLINHYTYRRRTNGAGVTDPKNDPTNWAAVNPVHVASGDVTINAAAGTVVSLPATGTLLNQDDIKVYPEARAANTAFTAADHGSFFDLSGTYTQTFDPVADLGDGWAITVRANKELPLTEIYSGAAFTEGADIVTNGAFAADTNWSKGSNWTISGGTANAANTSDRIRQTNILTVGTPYKATMDVTYTSGTDGGRLVLGNAAGKPNPATGAVTEYFTPSGVDLEIDGLITGGGGTTGFTGSIDNVTCKPLAAAAITALTIGKRYRLSWSISNYVSGAAGVKVGSQKLPAKSANGTHVQEFVATAAHATICYHFAGLTTDSLAYGSFAGTLGNVTLWEVSDAEITVDFSGAETCDGLASFKMYPGETRKFICNGAALTSTVSSPFRAIISATGNFTKPPGYQEFEGYLIAPGSGGAIGDSGGYSGGGAGGSACVPFKIPAWAISATEPVTIGAAGVGRTASEGDGYQGGNATFWRITALSGAPGHFSNGGNGTGGTGAGILAASNTDTLYDTLYGGSDGAWNTVGVSSYYGGAGGAGNTSSKMFPGGVSYLGGGGYGGIEQGYDGCYYGDSGGGVFGGTATKAGDGVIGALIITGRV